MRTKNNCGHPHSSYHSIWKLMFLGRQCHGSAPIASEQALIIGGVSKTVSKQSDSQWAKQTGENESLHGCYNCFLNTACLKVSRFWQLPSSNCVKLLANRNWEKRQQTCWQIACGRFSFKLTVDLQGPILSKICNFTPNSRLQKLQTPTGDPQKHGF